MHLEFVLNGAPQALDVDDGLTLLQVLRHYCGITSVKDGCAPQGQCGCCLALLNGAPKVTCAMPAAKAASADIRTLEGVSERDRDLCARAFAAAAGVQCGFCIPAIALRATWLLERRPRPSRAEIAKAIDVHLCRCTGYHRIIDAIELFGRARLGAPIPEPSNDATVGRSLVRYRAADLVLGTKPFVADLARPAMLHGAVVLSPHARARVRAVDVTRAAAVPGVVRIATAADVPGERWYGLIEQDWPVFVAVGEETRCVGDVLAAVAAKDEWTAREAARLVDVVYDVETPVLDPAAALAPGAPQVNPRHENLLSHTSVRRGDVDAALDASAHVVSGTWSTQRVEHLFLEPESALAEPVGGGRLRVFTGGQGIFDDRHQIAGVLGVAEEDVEVELVPTGGAFGGKRTCRFRRIPRCSRG